MKNFSWSSKNLWMQVIILTLSIVAGLGVELPANPADIAGSIVNTLSTSGVYAVAGILIVSVIGPVYNFIRTKPKLTLSGVLGDPNNWVYFGSFAVSLLVMVGINVPGGTAEQVVNAIFVKDWAALVTLIFGNLISPLIRYFIDKNKTATV